MGADGTNEAARQAIILRVEFGYWRAAEPVDELKRIRDEEHEAPRTFLPILKLLRSWIMPQPMPPELLCHGCFIVWQNAFESSGHPMGQFNIYHNTFSNIIKIITFSHNNDDNHPNNTIIFRFNCASRTICDSQWPSSQHATIK